MSDKLCAVCVEKVESGTDESKWGFDFGSFGSLWFHYRCADDLADASRRIRGQPEYAALEVEHKWTRREIERVGLALFTGANGYVGTEDDLKAIGQFVEGICDTMDALEARLSKMEEALRQIVEWSKAYPIDIFPEPDFKKVAKVLKNNGMTLDAVSASNMRHVITEVAGMAREALAGESDDE